MKDEIVKNLFKVGIKIYSNEFVTILDIDGEEDKMYFTNFKDALRKVHKYLIKNQFNEKFQKKVNQYFTIFDFLIDDIEIYLDYELY